jgi:transcriptional regulator with XRE-family HTH domain
MQERMITPAQLRAGRALLGLSQAELAGRACLSIHTVKRAERDGGWACLRPPWRLFESLLKAKV